MKQPTYLLIVNTSTQYVTWSTVDVEVRVFAISNVVILLAS